MGDNAIDVIGEFWDTKSTNYRRGRKILEDWHERCRLKRIEARIAERKRQLAEKTMRLEQERLRSITTDDKKTSDS